MPIKNIYNSKKSHIRHKYTISTRSKVKEKDHTISGPPIPKISIYLQSYKSCAHQNDNNPDNKKENESLEGLS